MTPPKIALAKICKGCSSEFVDNDKNQRSLFCGVCRSIKWKFYKSTKNWENSDRGKEYARQYHIDHKAHYKKIVFDYYGWECNCCDENVVEFLSIDHVNGGGSRERREEHISGVRLYKKIIKEGFSEDYQILCMNCNFGKKITGTICPHQL